MNRSADREWAYKQIDRLRDDQDEKYPRAEGGFNPEDRLGILVEEVGEIARALGALIPLTVGTDEYEDAYRQLYREILDVAAVSVRWLEAL